MKPRPNENNRRFAAIARNLKRIAPSQAFITDMTVYTDIHSRHARVKDRIYSNWYSAYLKMMYALPKVETYIDLEAITRAQIDANDLPCRSVKRAVEAGLLEPVPGYELLDKLM